MKNIVTTLLLSAALAMTFVSGDALAKRLGSGGDSGMQRSVSPAPANKAPSSPSTAPATAGAATTAAGAATKSSWMGPLMGLAAGGLLAAAFMGGAFDGISPMDIMLILLIVGGIFFFLRRRAAAAQAHPIPATAGTAGYTPADTQQRSGMENRDVSIGSRVGGNSIAQGSTDSTVPSTAMPAWFDEKAFTAQAKDWFVRLQGAWDKKDYTTLSSITTPELFEALREQIEQQTEHNVTKVDEVFAQVVECVQDAGQWVLTVRFNGYLSEQEGAFPHAFSEYWHLVRIGEAQGEWKLAGIQQDK
jgi:predicted lipid-binding transport protein (Tim44 family)